MKANTEDLQSVLQKSMTEIFKIGKQKTKESIITESEKTNLVSMSCM